MRAIIELWRGEVPLGRAFWLWGVLGGGLVNLLATMFALALVVLGAPTWVIVAVFVAHLPWNPGVTHEISRRSGWP